MAKVLVETVGDVKGTKSCCRKKREEKVRNLAYLMWEQAGSPDCDNETRNKFWFEAEKKLNNCNH